jgi:hypothetical protein
VSSVINGLLLLLHDSGNYSECLNIFLRYHVLKMALTWVRRIQECDDTDSDSLSTVNFEEDFMEMEMWKCLLQMDTELEVTAFPCNFIKEIPCHHIPCY